MYGITVRTDDDDDFGHVKVQGARDDDDDNDVDPRAHTQTPHTHVLANICMRKLRGPSAELLRRACADETRTKPQACSSRKSESPKLCFVRLGDAGILSKWVSDKFRSTPGFHLRSHIAHLVRVCVCGEIGGGTAMMFDMAL